jgi:hypothetical protein
VTANPGAVTPSKATFADVANDFLELFESLVGSGERSERTLELYRQHYRAYLEPRFGRLPIQKIGAEHVARMLADLRSTVSPRTQRPLASWTVKGIYALLGSVFNHAMTRGLVVETRATPTTFASGWPRATSGSCSRRRRAEIRPKTDNTTREAPEGASRLWCNPHG